ncbi:MAG: DNA-3-methyladenine glycosylase I [Bifidobacterium psychraerophilum]|uniref:DNA-3-methyladenine glycosylase I n=1 Tax=Bifidobacterium psychraerophilum TaxID=218140 RepID=UPI0039E82809
MGETGQTSKREAALHRCSWATGPDEAMRQYHDTEWGTPNHDSRSLFELLSLELMQSGLSWQTVLHKRPAFIKAFHNFDVHTVMDMDSHIDLLLLDAGIIRNRRKIQAIITNANAVAHLEDNGMSFATYVWQFVDGKPITNYFPDHSQSPCRTPLSDKMSKRMKEDGFSFVGPVVAYSFMEAAGLVNDHETACFRHQEL